MNGFFRGVLFCLVAGIISIAAYKFGAINTQIDLAKCRSNNVSVNRCALLNGWEVLQNQERSK